MHYVWDKITTTVGTSDMNLTKMVPDSAW